MTVLVHSASFLFCWLECALLQQSDRKSHIILIYCKGTAGELDTGMANFAVPEETLLPDN